MIIVLLNIIETLSYCGVCKSDVYAFNHVEDESLEMKMLNKLHSEQSPASPTQRRKSHSKKTSIKKKHSTKGNAKEEICRFCNKRNSQSNSKTSLFNVFVTPPDSPRSDSNKGDSPRRRSDNLEVNDALCTCSKSYKEELSKLEAEYKGTVQRDLGEMAVQIRMALFESGVVESVGPWLVSDDIKIQVH